MQDKVLVLSEAQAVTVSAASSNYLDPGVVTNPGYLFMLEVTVNTAFTSDSAATLTVSVEIGTDSTFGTKKTLVSSAAVAKADLTVGRQILVPVPHIFDTDEAYTYMRAYYTASATMTAGAVTTVLVPAAFTNH